MGRWAWMYGAKGMDVLGDGHGCMGRWAWMYGAMGMDVRGDGHGYMGRWAWMYVAISMDAWGDAHGYMGRWALSTIFQLYRRGGGNRSNQRNRPTCRKSLTNSIT